MYHSELPLLQERADNARVASEAAELHSLLQTGKLERQSQLQSLTELRMENSALLQRVAELDAKNDEQEKMLASVLSRTHSNGKHPGSSEDGIRIPGSDETAMAGKPVSVSVSGDISLVLLNQILFCSKPPIHLISDHRPYDIKIQSWQSTLNVQCEVCTLF